MRRAVTITLATLVLLAGATLGTTGAGADDRYPNDATLRLNQIQVLGSHNSYHKRLNPTFAAALGPAIDSVLGPGAGVAILREFDYEHAPLTTQFTDQGVRQIELDVWADPDGGLFAHRYSQELAGLPADPVPELHLPGFKVFHVQEIDVESQCWTFVSCLQEVKAWSDANPGHVPFTILVEAKADVTPDLLHLGYSTPIPFDAALLDDLDAEIRSVFGTDDLITPDVVRGSHATLEEAVLTDGWPTLEASRGKVLFALDNGGPEQTAYLTGHPSLEGRILFTSGSEPGHPETAFIKYNDPIGDFDKIQFAVAHGYIVRTRADADPKQATPQPPKPDLFATRDIALASGAQFVSTDYEVADPTREAEHPERTEPYVVQMPGGTPARCNPISAPAACVASDIEDPDALGPVPEPTPTTTSTTTASTTPTTPSTVTGFVAFAVAAPATAVSTSPRFTG